MVVHKRRLAGLVVELPRQQDFRQSVAAPRDKVTPVGKARTNIHAQEPPPSGAVAVVVVLVAPARTQVRPPTTERAMVVWD